MATQPVQVARRNYQYRRRNQQVRYYRTEAISAVATDVAVARATLALHVPDRETGLCVACLTAGPCEPANDAVNLLVALGLPVCPPVGRRMNWSVWWHRVRRRFAGAPQL